MSLTAPHQSVAGKPDGRAGHTGASVNRERRGDANVPRRAFSSGGTGFGVRGWKFNVRHSPRFMARLLNGLLPGLMLALHCTWAQPAKVASTLLAGQGRGSESPTSSAAQTAAVADLSAQVQARLTEAQADLGRAQAAQGPSTNPPPGATAAELIEYRAALQRLVRTCQLHLEDLAALEAARQRQDDLSRTIRSWTGFPEPPPYSVLMVDELRDAIQTLEERLRAANSSGAAVAAFLGEAQITVRESEERLRRLDEQAESAKDPDLVTRLTWQRKLEQARARTAAAVVAAFETKDGITRAELAEAQQRLAFARQRLALAEQHTRFTQGDLDRVLADLASQQARIEQELQETEAQLDGRRQALAEARAALAGALQAQPADAPAAATVRQWQEVIEVRDLERQTAVVTLSVLRQLLEGIGTERQMWQTRFAVAASRDLAELRNAGQRLPRLRDLVQSARNHYQQQIELAATQALEEERRLFGLANAPEAAALTRDRIATYRQREALYRRALEGLERRGRAVARWEEALDYEHRTMPLAARVRGLLAGARTWGARLWTFEIFAVEDTITVDGQKVTGRRGVTLGKILSAIAILAVGYWISAFLADLLERVVSRRFKVEANQANLIRRWARVVLVLSLIVFSLVSVKIPLTIFAFAGGALAIGVGFGTQNLLKNFISGIVILFERPFRVGDVLAVGPNTGLVTSIGIRSSVIQLWDGTETLIPNSALLENQLTNWTYSSRTVRFLLTVGVAYGSDTRRVAQLMAEAADRHGQVEKEPRPLVLFTDFGDNALTFELRYWVDVLKYNAAQIASDLRHMLNGAFQEHAISVAYPQRDVHLTTLRPIPVQVIGQPAGSQLPSPITPETNPHPGSTTGEAPPAAPGPSERNNPP